MSAPTPNRPAGPIQFRVELDRNAPLPRAEAANYFALASVGTEVQLLVGTLNLLNVASGQPATPQITHCFLLSPFAFGHLARQIEVIKRTVVDSGAEWDNNPTASVTTP